MYKITGDDLRRPPAESSINSEVPQLEAVSTQSPLFDPTTLFSDPKEPFVESPIIAVLDPEELTFELGLWLAGLTSFIKLGTQAFDKVPVDTIQRDWALECRLTHAALLKCSKLNFRLRKATVAQHDDHGNSLSVSANDLDAFTLVLRDLIVLNESILRAGKLDFADWRSWADTLSEKLASSTIKRRLVDASQASGATFLPAKLRSLVADSNVPFADEVDLHIILPQFGVILGSLNVVGNMLQHDEPLKPSLIIFSRIYEQTSELITHMNNRLSRFPTEEAPMFDSLDGASYTASLELKKVYSQELTGLAGMRPVPAVFARVETACELLSDSFRQILAGFARILDPHVQLADLFPKFDTKLERSLALREHLWKLIAAVHAAEQNPEKRVLELANSELQSFLELTAPFLYHKDKETFERFAEEVFATTERKDIVPILHRFGAYLETLLGQVNMRTVLANHPFDH